ncbi:MAG: hypothetical protein ACXAAH_15330, partial [Promethearchaeota archaeon]
MKKRLTILILFVLIIEVLNFSNSVIGFQYNLYNLEVDKDCYYPNEVIGINASWSLDYNPVIEEAYIQVKLTDEFDTVIWNSSKYDGIGNYTENWEVHIEELNLTFQNYTHYLYIKFLSFYQQFGMMEIVSDLLGTVKIKIIKRIPSCQLIGFKDQINYGESLSFQANFFDNNTLLKNQLIIFLICSNSSTLFQTNYTTNDSGIIEISISSTNHLSLGVNKLILKIGHNNVFNDSVFQYEVFLEKNPVFIDIINFKEELERWEDLIIDLSYYYFFNNTKSPLENQSIELVILNDNKLRYAQIYNTDINGVLSITIPHEFLSSYNE